MKTLSLIILAVLGVFLFSVSILSKTKTVVRTHILQVESVNNDKANIPFIFVYSLGDSNSTKALVTVEKITPFKMEITNDHFTGLIQDKSLKGEVEVSVKTFENGIESKWVKSRCLLNVIRVNKNESHTSSY